MNQTVIGVFDTLEQAQVARTRLESEGVSASDIQIHGQTDSDMSSTVTDAATRRDVETTRAGTQHEGAMGRIEHFFKRLFGDDDRPEEAGHYQEAVRRGSIMLSVEVADEAAVTRVRSALSEAGAVDIDARVAVWRTSGYAGYDSAAPMYTADEVEAERKAFPVVQEALEVGKREVSTGGVRVYSRVTETPVSESVDLREARATVERRAVDRPATEADLKEGSLEIRETAEHAVVGKTARVVEEVVVGKETSTRTEEINDSVRGTNVEVERIEGKPTPDQVENSKRRS